MEVKADNIDNCKKVISKLWRLAHVKTATSLYLTHSWSKILYSWDWVS